MTQALPCPCLGHNRAIRRRRLELPDGVGLASIAVCFPFRRCIASHRVTHAKVNDIEGNAFLRCKLTALGVNEHATTGLKRAGPWWMLHIDDMGLEGLVPARIDVMSNNISVGGPYTEDYMANRQGIFARDQPCLHACRRPMDATCMHNDSCQRREWFRWEQSGDGALWLCVP